MLPLTAHCVEEVAPHHSREDTGSGNGQHRAQNLPVRVCHHHHLRCLRTGPCECSISTDVHMPVVLNKILSSEKLLQILLAACGMEKSATQVLYAYCSSWKC